MRFLCSAFLFLLLPFVSYGQIHIEVFQGEKILPYIKELTQIALHAYREYPYLYEGTEEEYLPIMMQTCKGEGIAAIAFDGDKPIGTAIGMPIDYEETFRHVFLDDPCFDSIYYLSQLILLKEYRSCGYAKQMVHAFEKGVENLNRFNTICLCQIAEEENERPSTYYSMDSFWIKQGYTEHRELYRYVKWLDIDQSEPSWHLMLFWTKPI